MSHSLPTAPPLPAHNEDKSAIPICVTPTKYLIEECLWALDYPELQKACFLARVCADQPPRQCQLRNIAGILQEGPTCGLTALSMLLGGTLPPQQLLATAKELHYTNNGEMFSARNLFQLITETLANESPKDNYSGNAFECHMHEGQLNCSRVKDCLLNGACLFVPYDPDFNHSPCLKLGHKAHWALIVGYLISDDDEFYVLARHGKAKNLAVWSLRALSDSNSNLVEFAQPKGYPDSNFVLPLGGIGGDLGLRERAIIVTGMPNEIIKIR